MKKRILINILEWIPIVGAIYTIIIGVINVRDYLNGKTLLYEGYEPDYAKAIFFRINSTFVFILNGLWHGIITGRIIALFFGC